jgi:hypothetical protein
MDDLDFNVSEIFDNSENYIEKAHVKFYNRFCSLSNKEYSDSSKSIHVQQYAERHHLVKHSAGGIFALTLEKVLWKQKETGGGKWSLMKFAEQFWTF